MVVAELADRGVVALAEDGAVGLAHEPICALGARAVA
jgi:hypothetical protein